MQSIQHLLPGNGERGGQWQDHHKILNGLFWRLRTGSPWRDIPERYGPWSTIYDRFRRWSRDGTLDRIIEAPQVRLDGQGEIDWDLFCIDGSSIRASRAAAGAGKGGGAEEPADHALGRSRGGYGTKVHLVVDGNGLPLAAEVTAGQRHESTQFERVMDAVRVPQRVGRPRRRPKAVAGDKGYSYNRIRRWLRRRHIGAVIPQRKDQVQKHRGRPLKFDEALYRRRNVVERCVGWLKECRAVATRFEKLARHYLGMVKLAMIQRYLRLLDSSYRT